ncbi:efflux transporter outer membrane subunit [Caballeronia sordidicola]|uniref:Outer membrane component of tripartite multidrug resistance system n=1 Tax=Caballeronia sordidicola TaxID=196367 RepID=A0A242MYN4_CABSO|nr:TolC family protein [Caballeronia sordidicola]OTP76530.1 Outer membrane component of tripartite multidrug resistance system [Caballeronia sordidicola]
MTIFLVKPHWLRPSVAACIAFVVGLPGCAVGPDYAKPASDLAAFHNHVTASTEQAVAVAPQIDTWWTGFDDPMLVTVVQRALAQNLDLAAAFARVQQARAVAAWAGAELLPTIDFNASTTAQYQSLTSPAGSITKTFPGYSRDQREYTVGPAASWEIDLAGGLRRGAAAARGEAEAAQAEQMGTRITVAADVADAYLQIRGFQTRLAVAQDQVDTDAQLLKLIEVRRRVGAADEREVAQAQALLKQASSTLPTLRTALEAQLNRLDVLMGAQPGTYARELDIAGVIPGIPRINNTTQPLDVLRRRPDVIAAERRLAASNERIGAALSDYYPKISLSGALGFDSGDTSHLFTAGAFQAIGSGALRWRLFDFGKVDAEVKQARGANAEALALYRQAVLKAAEDVENSLMTLSQTDARRQELQGEVTALIRARDLSERSYKSGAINLTDVLDADRQLLSARDDLDSARADVARAAVSVFRALGGGWSEGQRVVTESSVASERAGSGVSSF